MRRIGLRVVMIAGVVAIPGLTRAAAPTVASLAEHCEIEVAESFGDQRKFVRAWTTDGALAGLDKAHIEAADVADGRVLVIEIGGKAFGYAGSVGVRGGVAETRTFECKCSADELVAKVAEEVAAVAPGLVAAAQTVPPPVVDDGPAPVRTIDTPPSDDTPRSRKLGKLGRGGAVMLGIGIPVTIGGVVLLALGERTKRERDSDRGRAIDFRPAGGATLGVGVALVITGAVLVAVDKKRARDARRVAMTPAVGAREFGLTITGRF